MAPHWLRACIHPFISKVCKSPLLSLASCKRSESEETLISFRLALSQRRSVNNSYFLLRNPKIFRQLTFILHLVFILLTYLQDPSTCSGECVSAVQDVSVLGETAKQQVWSQTFFFAFFTFSLLTLPLVVSNAT